MNAQPAVASSSGAAGDPSPSPSAGPGPERTVSGEKASLVEVGPPPPPSPDSLVGLTGGALEALLGSPDLTTQEPPAQIWRYRFDLCTVFFILYESEGGGDPTVKHVDVKTDEGAQIQPHLCLSGIDMAESPETTGEPPMSASPATHETPGGSPSTTD